MPAPEINRDLAKTAKLCNHALSDARFPCVVKDWPSNFQSRHEAPTYNSSSVHEHQAHSRVYCNFCPKYIAVLHASIQSKNKHTYTSLPEKSVWLLCLPSMKMLTNSHSRDAAMPRHHAHEGHGMCFPGMAPPVCCLKVRSYLIAAAT